MEIRQNYENYQRVKDAFKEFIHALVWESADIECGAPEDEIDEHIEKYCKNNADQMIALTNDSVSAFIKTLESRYQVCLYENGIEETKFHTNNLSLALKKAARYYRSAMNPQVEIYDNQTNTTLTKWV